MRIFATRRFAQSVKKGTSTMKILVFSDSHGSRNHLDFAIREHLKFGGIDKIFFLGDGIRDIKSISLAYPNLDIDYVYGNCDASYSSHDDEDMWEKVVDVGGIKFMIMHGHLHDVKETYQFAADHAIANKADVLLFGHTHRAEDVTIDGSRRGHIRMINPGSSGYGYNSSYALLNIVGRDVICGFGQFK
ncbi:MAG: YfcE family phosphodiesterase [Ruminococcaceae bacterium]|nr:YfcE family phosphodiesterase [Oscillospiraceae bacterium]